MSKTTDYDVTRRVATKITDRFSNMLRRLEDDFEEEIVVHSLTKLYKLCSVPVTDEGGMDMGVDEYLLWAIESILLEYMSPDEFKEWVLTLRDKTEE